MTAPLPPAIVSVGRGEEINLLTVGWTGILATKPPKTYISVRPTRHSHALLMKYPEFVINLPSADMARAVDFVGIYTGKKMNKFERSGLTPTESTVVSAPTVAECPVAIECRVCEVVSMGSHDVFFADIVAISTHDEIVDPDGKLRFDLANLLAYAHGEYFKLGERLGKFGFSTQKEEKATTRVKKTRTEDTKKPSGTRPQRSAPKKHQSATKANKGKKRSYEKG